VTFSIVARSENGEFLGVGVASRCLAVGRAVPAAEVGVGAVATQAHCNLRYKADGLASLRGGADARQTVDALVSADPLGDQRQVGVVDAAGNSATHTGVNCIPWAGGTSGPGYAIQGNLLAGPQVIAAMERAWLASTEDQPLGRRILAVLLAGDRAGGDRRGRQSAALLVVSDNGAYEGGGDEYADLRVDDHHDPVLELGRLYDIRDLDFVRGDAATALPIEGEVLRELEVLLDRVGYPVVDDDRADVTMMRDRISPGSADTPKQGVEAALERWAMDEFKQLRILPGAIDRMLLAELRRRAGAAWEHAS
jgi:uncharacterized Ntn-hydrolase superfamily protein